MKLKYLSILSILALLIFSHVAKAEQLTIEGGPVFICMELNDIMKVANTHKDKGLDAAQAVWQELSNAGKCGASVVFDTVEAEQLAKYVVGDKVLTVYSTKAGQTDGKEVYFALFSDARSA